MLNKTENETVCRVGPATPMGRLMRVRRRLLAAAEALVNSSVASAAVDHPEAYAVRGGGFCPPNGAGWLEATAELRKAFVNHPELDPTVAGD